MQSNNYLIYLIEKAYNETGTLIYQRTAEEEAENASPSKEHELMGQKIADESGLEYKGWWNDLNAWWFNDPITHSTIIAKSVEEAKHKKEKQDILRKASQLKKSQEA